MVFCFVQNFKANDNTIDVRSRTSVIKVSFKRFQVIFFRKTKDFSLMRNGILLILQAKQ